MFNECLNLKIKTMRNIFTILLILVFFTLSFGQVPTTGDCMGSQPVCTNSYSPAMSPSGIGSYSEVPIGRTPCGTYEKNSTWYSFTVQTAGWFTFTLNSTVDYDWALYDLSNNSCANILSGAVNSVRCNYSATTGNTGISAAGINDNEDASGSVWSNDIWCNAGQDFALLVDNYAGGTTNYWLQFNPGGGGAGIIDNTGPSLGSVNPPTCGATTLTFQFTEDVACTSVQASDLSLTGPGGPYTFTGISGLECSTGAVNGRTFTVNVTPALTTSGNFVLSMIDAIQDKCNNATNTLVTLPFTITTMTASTAISNSVSCYSGTNGALTVNHTGGTAPFTYNWNTAPVQTGQTATGISAGTYNVTVTDQFGCHVSTSGTLSQPPALSPGSVATSQSICYNTAPAALTSTNAASGGTGSIVYQWQYTTDPSCASGWADISGATGASYTPSALTQTTCFRRKATDNCSSTYTTYSNSETITVNPLPVIVSAIKTDVSICGGSNGTISINATGAAPLTYSIDGGSSYAANSGLFSGLPQGSYTVAVRNGNGCVVIGSILIINAASAPPAPSAGFNAIYCQGDLLSDLWATAAYSGTLNWYSDPALNSNIGSGISTITPFNTIGVTPYYVTETTSGCESAPTQINVTINPIPVVTATPTSQTICSGASTSVDISSSVSGTTYSWSFAQAGVSGASNPTVSIYQVLMATSSFAGTVNYTVIPSANGCSGSPVSVPVTVNPNPDVIITPPSQTVCSGASTDILLSSLVSGTTFNWTVTQNNANGALDGSGNSINQQLFANGIIQGSVTYIVTPSANTCSGNSQNIDVIINPTPDINANPSAPFICSGTSPNITFSSSVPGTSFSWTVIESGVSGANAGGGSTISQTINCTSAVTGSATYTITPSANTCLGIPADIIVTVNPVPTLVASPSSETVCTYGTTAINLSSNVVGASFSWTVAYSANIIGPSNGSGTSINQMVYNTSSVADIATYTVTSNYFNCSSLPLNVPVTINPFPLVIATPVSESICSGTVSNIALSSNVTGTAFSWTVSNSSNITGASNANGLVINQTLTNLTSTIDSVIYTVIASANLCSGDTLNIPITVLPQPVIISTDTSYTSCGGTDGTITIIASGAMPLEYSIDNSVSFFANAGFFTGLGNGNYQVAVRDANGCVTNGPLLGITELNAPPAPIAGTDAIYCSGDIMADMTVTASSGGVLTWYADAALTTVITTGTSLTPGNTIGIISYYVTEGTGGCESPSSTVTITIKPLPVLIPSPPAQTFCSGGTTSLTFISNPTGGTFDWTVVQNNVSGAVNGSGAIINQTLTTLTSSAGTVVYSITPLVNGCYGTPADVNVIVNPLPVVVLTLVSDVCQNVASITLNGGTPHGGSYSGSGVSGNTFIPSSAGLGLHQITYTYIDGNGCINSATDSIAVNPLPTVLLAPFSPVCADAAPFALTGGSPVGGTYYGNGVTGSIFDPVAAGIGSINITYSYTNSSNCISTASALLVVSPMPIVNISYSTPITCNGANDGIAMANTLDGTLPFSYLWDNIPPTTSSTVTGLSPNVWYHVTVTDNNGCKDKDSISMAEPNILTILPTHTNPTCGLINGSAFVAVNGGSFPYTYWWSNGGTDSSLNNIAAGVYFVTATDAHGCTVDTIISLTTYPLVNANLVVTNPTCFGYTNGSVQAIITGGTGPFAYLWSNGATTATVTGLSADTVSLLITDVHTCSFSDTVILTQPIILTLSLSTTDVSCFGMANGIINTIVLGGTIPYSYHWSTTSLNPSLVAGSGIYSVTIIDSHSCSVVATDTIFQPLSALSAFLLTDSTNCWGDSTGSATVTPIGGTPSYTYLWSTNPIQTSNHSINLKAGLYIVTVTDYNLCHYIDTLRIHQPSKIEINSFVIPTSCEEGDDGQIEVHPFGGFSPYNVLFFSEPPQFDSIAENLNKGSYDVKVTDKLGCYSIFTIGVKNTDIPCLQIPTAFTPNVDGIHDTWNIKNLYLYPKAKMEVYNRWGSLIYSAGVSDQRWDGKFNGVDVPTGTYIYIINLGNETKPKQGTVTIIR